MQLIYTRNQIQLLVCIDQNIMGQKRTWDHPQPNKDATKSIAPLIWDLCRLGKELSHPCLWLDDRPISIVVEMAAYWLAVHPMN